jgi:hypothetical protein
LDFLKDFTLINLLLQEAETSECTTAQAHLNGGKHRKNPKNQKREKRGFVVVLVP